jgi:putative endonuclease
MPTSTLESGKTGENLACDYLQQQGLTLLARNFRSRYGEIDLIMRDGSTVVFVEVRARQQHNLVDSLQSINASKQKKLIKTALYYLQTHSKLMDYPARFDVIAITNQPAASQINWIKDAFQTQ